MLDDCRTTHHHTQLHIHSFMIYFRLQLRSNDNSFTGYFRCRQSDSEHKIETIASYYPKYTYNTTVDHHNLLWKYL